MTAFVFLSFATRIETLSTAKLVAEVFVGFLPKGPHLD